MSIKLCLFMLGVFGLFESWAHIAWLFPSPRTPVLDSLNFEDDFHPCGGSTKEGPSNIFIVGRTYTISWRILHRHLKDGRLQINLLYSNGTEFKRLVPNEDGPPDLFTNYTHQQQSIAVTFEDACRDCILQLLKKDDLSEDFVTCADVQILTDVEGRARRNEETECQSRGLWKPEGRCECDNEYEGEYCEQAVDCKIDSDCGNNGICREQWRRRSSDRLKICYCQFGKFGRNCEKDSQISLDKCFNVKGLHSEERMDFVSYGLFDESCYRQTNLAENDFIYSRVVGTELEIILDFDTVSYVALGWKPMDVDVKCREFSMTTYSENVKSADKALHPMACVDMVWASVINESYLNIRDGYSSYQHVLLEDENYPSGQNSITSAFGVQIFDRTIVMFRRPISIGKLFGIFAKGQTEEERQRIVNQDRSQNNTSHRQDEFESNGEVVVTFEFVRKPEEANTAVTKARGGALILMLIYLMKLIREP